MIVFSLLLILVAVTLLVLGLAGGSSSLLIASIVVSLLAAIALVIGARQTSAARRTAAVGPDPLDVDPLDVDVDADPGPAEPAAPRRGFRRPAATQPVSPAASGRPDHVEAAAYRRDTAAAAQGAPTTSDSGSYGPVSATGGLDESDSAGLDSVGFGPDAASGRSDPAGSAGRDSTGYGSDASSGAAAEFYGSFAAGAAATGQDAGPVRDRDAAYGGAPADDAGLGGAPQGAERQRGRRSGERAEQPDYDRAATFIGGARAQDEGRDDSWGRDPSAAQAEAALGADAGAADAVSGASTGSGAAFLSGTDGPGFAGGTVGDGSGFSDGSGLSDEFGEPDPDDPADEPLPQAVRAADAVRIARMDAEVLVVDGRPRFHFADCPHLVGRLTEPLPVAEAVELGFNPCGLCRPVDRLVAAAARR